MIIIKGKAYNTTIDAARVLGVSSKTVRDYIKKGIISNPPEIKYGIRIIKYFPEDYLEKAKAALQKYSNGNSGNSSRK